MFGKTAAALPLLQIIGRCLAGKVLTRNWSAEPPLFPMKGEPDVKWTRAKSSAVKKGREIETRKRRTKAQMRKTMPGMWNARVMMLRT